MIAAFGLVSTISSVSASSECGKLSLLLLEVVTTLAQTSSTYFRHAGGHRVWLCGLNQFLSQPVIAAAETVTRV